MSDLVWMTTIGFIFGSVARAFLPPKDRTGVIMTEVLGIVGAVAVTFIAQIAGWYAIGGKGIFVCAAIGAGITLFTYGLLLKKQNSHAGESR